MLTEIKNRGVADVCMVVCDGLKGLPEAIEAVWPQAITQTCVVHLLRNSFRYASKTGLGGDRQGPEAGLHRAHGGGRAGRASSSSPASGRQRYPAIIRLWENAWAEFVPFLQFDTEIRSVVCTTNAIESINARIRRAVNARGHFPTEQAALKCVYLAVMSLDPTGTGQKRWTNRWKAALERLRDHLRRTPVRRPPSNTKKISYTEIFTDPNLIWIWPAFRDDHRPRSAHQEYALAEQGKRGAAVGLALEHLEPVDVALDDARAPWHGEAVDHGVVVAFDAADEGVQVGLVVGFNGGDPVVEAAAVSVR